MADVNSLKIKEFEDSGLLEIIDGDRGKNYPRKDEFFKNGYCVFLNTSNIVDDNLYLEKLDFITKEKDSALRKGKLQRGDVIMTTRGTIGSVAYFNEKIPFENMRINSGMIIVRANNKKMNANYLYQVLKSPLLKNRYKLFSSGAAQPQLPIQDFRMIDLPLFEISTQEKIAKILSNYDDLIENNNKRIKILEELAQKIYKEWFVDFKFPGNEITTFKDTELGKIPSEWEIKVASQIADIYIGRTPSRKDFDCFTNNIGKKWVSIKDMGTSGCFVFDTSECLTNESIKKYNVPLIPSDTVILSFKLTVGKIAITTEEMCSNEAIAQFNIKNIKITPTYYLYLYLKNFKYENLGNTSSIGNAINSTIIKNMPIVNPSVSIVKEFDNIVSSIFNGIKTLTLQNQILKQTRDLLLPRLISGEIDVEKLEIV